MLTLVELLLRRWTDLAFRLRWIVIAVFALATAFAGWFAAGNLKVNTDTSAMIDPSLDFQKRAAALREAFPETKNDIAVVVRAPTIDEVDAFASALRTRMLARPESFSGVFAPAAEPFFTQNSLLYLDTDELEQRLTQMSKAAGLIETLIRDPGLTALFTTLAENDELAEKSELGKETLQAIYGELASVVEAGIEGTLRPFSWMGALDTEPAPPGGHVRLVYATPMLDFARLQPAKPALDALRGEIAALAPQFGGRVETFVTGDPALRADELSAVSTGIGLSFGLSFLLVAAILYIGYRSTPLALATLAALVVTIVITSGFAAAFIGELNLVSVAFTVLLVGLGLDFAIHLLMHVHERRSFGEDRVKALSGSVHEVGPALVLAAFTTSIGFFAFVPTRFDGIAQLGIIAGAGVGIALIVTVTLLPAILGAVDIKAPPRRRLVAGKGLAERLSGPVAIVALLAGLPAALLAPQARFDADPMSLRDPNSQSVRGFNVLFEDIDTTPYRLTRITADRDDAIETAALAQEIPGVAGVRLITSFVPDNQEDKLDLIDFAAGALAFALDAAPQERAPAGADAQREAIADAAQALATRLDAAHAPDTPARRLADALRRAIAAPQTLPLIERYTFVHWPALVTRLRAQLTAEIVDEDALPAALARRYRSANGDYRVDILPSEDLRDPRALDRFVDAVEAVFPDIAGGAAQSRQAGAIIASAMAEATVIALVVIVTFLTLLLRRFGDVALMLIPLMLAAVLTTAAGVVLGIPFNYANVIVLPLLLGIGVDSGIHLVMRHRLLKEGETLYGASTSRAVFFSALTTVASFGSLMLSPHRGTASMGQLLSIAIAFTLVCTLLVLPALLRWRDRSAAAKPPGSR